MRVTSRVRSRIASASAASIFAAGAETDFDVRHAHLSLVFAERSFENKKEARRAVRYGAVERNPCAMAVEVDCNVTMMRSCGHAVIEQELMINFPKRKSAAPDGECAHICSPIGRC